MPSHIPESNPLEADETREKEREANRSRRNGGDDASGRRSQDTDPDSPDADIDRDDMLDEP